MGKYMRKGKGIGEVAVMEVSQVGVRTRARVLAALQIARKLGPTKSPSAMRNHDHESRLKSSCVDSMQTSYLELRSRRLQKVCRCYPKERSSAVPASNNANIANNSNDDEDNSSTNEEDMEDSRLIFSDDTTNQSFSHTSNSYRQAIAVQKIPEFSSGSRRTRANSRTNSGTFSRCNSRGRPRSLRLPRGEENCVEIKHEGLQKNTSDDATTEVQIWQMEASFGENVMDNDPRYRRETTPSSNVSGEAETLETPGSTTRCAHSERVQNEARMRLCDGPTSQEIDEFFAGAEKLEHRRFAERYNYDTLNDVPLAGRFDWVRLMP